MRELTQSSIQNIGAAAVLYNKLVAKLGSSAETTSTAELFGTIENSMKAGLSLYEQEPKSVNKWCNAVTPLLTTYQKENSPALQQNLVATLEQGKTVMKDVQKRLGQSTVNFNSAAGDLVSLENRLANYFMDHTETTDSSVSQLIADINGMITSIREFYDEYLCARDGIAIAYHDIGEVKVSIESTQIYINIDSPELRSAAIESSNNLIAQCVKYHQRYD